MPALDKTHDPARRSWVAAANEREADFPIQNLPFGVFRRPGERPRGGVAIGDAIVDLAAVRESGLLHGDAAGAAAAASGETLNALLALGGSAARALRSQLSDLLAHDALDDVRERVRACLTPAVEAELLLPVAVGAFSDFLCSFDHMRRMGNGSIPAAFSYLPIAYNSRATSIRPSGLAIRRPNGQFRDAAGTPAYGPEPALDFELELGAFVGPGNALGEPVPIGDASAHLFGFCLLNDWSARDIQSFESQPLGPFLSKSFATTISPWIVTADALAPFRCALRERAPDAPAIPRHLHADSEIEGGGLAIALEASIATPAMRAAGRSPATVTRTNFRTMYWTFGQMLVHHTSNGCNLAAGDLLGSGTTSGATDESRACLAELTARGTTSIAVGDETRTWLEDGDEVIFRAVAARQGYVSISFGTCRAVVLPAP